MTKQLLEGRTIVVVEDDIVNISVICVTLRQFGARVLFERWAENALQTIHATKNPDLIILDYMLSNKITGFDVLEAIKKDKSLEGVPVVMVTAADPDLLLRKARESGLQGLITKPIRQAQFGQQISSVLNGEEVWMDIDY